MTEFSLSSLRFPYLQENDRLLMNANSIINEDVRKYYNYKIESYEDKYRDGHITHLHTGFFDPAILDQKLSIDQLQSHLIQGQKRLTDHALGLIPWDCKLVLDLGAGHGGTSFILAGGRDVQIHALTISDRQADLIVQRAKKLKLEEKISVICSDIFNHDFGVIKYDAIIGVESFCQISELNALIRIVSDLLNPSGVLVLSDYFSDVDEFKNYFDRHWCCNIHSFTAFIKSLNNNQMHIRYDFDFTLKQSPFWSLSALHSTLRLQMDQGDKETERLMASKEFHQYMYKAFIDRTGIYKQLVAVKNSNY